VLLRSDEPNLTDPVQVLEAAELLGSLDELGRVIASARWKPSCNCRPTA
jgi:hypothetical protein